MVIPQIENGETPSARYHGCGTYMGYMVSRGTMRNLLVQGRHDVSYASCEITRVHLCYKVALAQNGFYRQLARRMSIDDLHLPTDPIEQARNILKRRSRY